MPGEAVVTLTLLYHNPKRPDEDDMTMIVNHAKAEAMIGQIEKRGLLIKKITFAPSR
jgi:hypothetical protein